MSRSRSLNVSTDATIVQKYGGTSVGTVERIDAVATRVAGQVRAGHKRIAIVVSAMAGETNRFVELIRSVNPKAPAKSYDMAVAAGEQVSVALMSAALEKQGVASEPYLAYQVGIYTSTSHSKARIQEIRTDKIVACWEAGKIPVIAGFQGVTEEMALTTLGRGGSDISAVALAAALKADFCEINTDVDGVFTCDPRIVPDARLIDTLDYDTCLELAALGGKVLHSRCVEVGAKYQIPIIVRNSFLPDEDNRRTVIMSFDPGSGLESPVVSAITVDKNVAKLTIAGIPSGSESLARVFEEIAKQKINVDIIIHNRISGRKTSRVGFTVSNSEVESAFEKLQTSFPDAEIVRKDDLAKVSVVGLGMRTESGVASRVFSVLAKEGVDIKMISTSEIKISCVVKEVDAEKVTLALHRHFFQD